MDRCLHVCACIPAYICMYRHVGAKLSDQHDYLMRCLWWWVGGVWIGDAEEPSGNWKGIELVASNPARKPSSQRTKPRSKRLTSADGAALNFNPPPLHLVLDTCSAVSQGQNLGQAQRACILPQGPSQEPQWNPHVEPRVRPWYSPTINNVDCSSCA